MSKAKEILAEMLETGVGQITILEGAAPEQLNPQGVSIAGLIDAPRRFITARAGTFEAKLSHAIVNANAGSIKLVIDENNPHDDYDITGVIQKGRTFAGLGINGGQKYTTSELSRRFRMLRNIFPDKDSHAKIVKTLRNVKAKIDKEIESTDDLRGTRTEIFAQKVESNVPETFTIEVSLIEGQPKAKIEIFVYLEVGESGQILCFMESVDAAEAIDALMEKIMAEEIKFLEKNTTVILV